MSWHCLHFLEANMEISWDLGKYSWDFLTLPNLYTQMLSKANAVWCEADASSIQEVLLLLLPWSCCCLCWCFWPDLVNTGSLLAAAASSCFYFSILESHCGTWRGGWHLNREFYLQCDTLQGISALPCSGLAIMQWQNALMEYHNNNAMAMPSNAMCFATKCIQPQNHG